MKPFETPMDSGVNLKHISEYENPIMWEDENPNLYIITETIYSKDHVNELRKFIYDAVGKKIGLKIVSCIPHKANHKQVDRNPNRYHINHGHKDITKYVPPYAKVIAEGRAITYLTDGDLRTYDFHDYITNDTFFFHPNLRTNVYPIDYLSSFIDLKKGKKKDDFPYFFAILQILKTYKQTIEKKRWKLPDFEKVIDMKSFYDKFKDEPKIAIDSETDGLDWFTCNIGCITVAFDTKKGYYLPWEVIDPVEFGHFIKDKFQIYQNGQFDIKVFRRNGIPTDCLWVSYDTMHGGQVVNEMSLNSLKSQAWTLAKMGGYDKPLEEYKALYPKTKSYLDFPEEVLMPYASYDPVATMRLYERQNEIVDDLDKRFPIEKDQRFYKSPIAGTTRSYLYSLFPAINAINDSEYEGMLINIDVLKEESDKFKQELREQRDRVYNVFPGMDKIDMGSALQLSSYLKEHGYEPIDVSANYQKNEILYLLGDKQTQEYVRRGYKEFEEFRKYRRLIKLFSSFVGEEVDSGEFKISNIGDEVEDVDYGTAVFNSKINIEEQKNRRTNKRNNGKGKATGLWKYLKYHEDGTVRVHTSISAFLKLSGRNGSKAPNLQQIPKHGEDDYSHRIRRIFSTPSPEYSLAELDGKGFQLRIGAALSNDEAMRKAFSDPKIKGDLHSVTTQAIFKPGLTIEEVLKLKSSGDTEIIELRHKGKQANLSLEFGSSGLAFAMSTISSTWTIKEAEEYIKSNDLQDNLRHLKELDSKAGKDRRFKGKDEESYVYWTVANDIKKKFFSRYKGLKNWTTVFTKFPDRFGYVRTIHGAFRRLPYLKYIGEDTHKGKVKNWHNISLNTLAQNYENFFVTARLFYGIWRYIKDNNLKSRVIMTVHDSIVLYLHKEEKKLIIDKAREIFEFDYPENNGVKMELEAKVADYWGKGETWGEGEEL